MKRVFFSLLFCLLPVMAWATDLPMDIAVLRGLDKVTGRISTFSIPVGQMGQFGKTFIVPEACYQHPPEESPENSVFLYVFEKSTKGENIELFKGWMFSSNPALSSMEHPVYDVWVIDCLKDDAAPEKSKEVIDQTAAPDMSTEGQSAHKAGKNPSTESGAAPVLEEGTSAADLVPDTVEMEDL